MKLNTKKVQEYVQKHQKELTALKQYMSKNQQNSLNSNKIIIQINDEIKKTIKSISQHKQAAKSLKEYAENNQERQTSEKNAEYIKIKVSNWVLLCEGILDNVKETMRAVELKNQKKHLSEQEIVDFRKYLTDSMFNFEQNKQAIVQHFATQQLNSNCILLESITNQMQRLGNK